MKLERVEEIVQNFQSKCILVLGDLMLDEFVWGRVSRISPEAPVPVVDVIRESSYPGGAANVARNVKEFSSSVLLMGTSAASAKNSNGRPKRAKQIIVAWRNSGGIRNP